MTASAAMTEQDQSGRLKDSVKLSADERLENVSLSETAIGTIKFFSIDNPEPSDMGVLWRDPVLPDSSFYTAWVDFRNASNTQFTAVVVRTHPAGPYVMLSTSNRMASEEIKDIAKVVAGYFGGLIRDTVSDWGDRISLKVALKQQPTQKQVSRFAANPPEGIFESHVTVAHYHNVSVRDYLKAGFPPEGLFEEPSAGSSEK